MRGPTLPKLQLYRPDLDTIELSVNKRSTPKISNRVDNSPNSLRAMQESCVAATDLRNTLALANTMSQRMEDLAREFYCLGYFGSDDGPKAA